MLGHSVAACAYGKDTLTETDCKGQGTLTLFYQAPAKHYNINGYLNVNGIMLYPMLKCAWGQKLIMPVLNANIIRFDSLADSSMRVEQGHITGQILLKGTSVDLLVFQVFADQSVYLHTAYTSQNPTRYSDF